jgi:hypothetical protein
MAKTRDSRRAVIRLALRAEVLGLDVEAVAIILAMAAGRRGVRVIDRRGGYLVVDLPQVAARRLGLVKVAGRWRIPPGGPKAEDRGRPRRPVVRLDALPGPVVDPRARTPPEILAAAEEPTDRIASLARWLERWSRTGGRDVPRPDDDCCDKH